MAELFWRDGCKYLNNHQKLTTVPAVDQVTYSRAVLKSFLQPSECLHISNSEMFIHIQNEICTTIRTHRGAKSIKERLSVHGCALSWPNVCQINNKLPLLECWTVVHDASSRADFALGPIKRLTGASNGSIARVTKPVLKTAGWVQHT